PSGPGGSDVGLSQPKIKSAVRCGGRAVGEVAHVIADPLSLEISDIVVRSDGKLWQVPASAIGAVGEESLDLLCGPEQMAHFPVFTPEHVLTSKEVQVPHLGQGIHADPR